MYFNDKSFSISIKNDLKYPGKARRYIAFAFIYVFRIIQLMVWLFLPLICGVHGIDIEIHL